MYATINGLASVSASDLVLLSVTLSTFIEFFRGIYSSLFSADTLAARRVRGDGRRLKFDLIYFVSFSSGGVFDGRTTRPRSFPASPPRLPARLGFARSHRHEFFVLVWNPAAGNPADGRRVLQGSGPVIPWGCPISRLLPGPVPDYEVYPLRGLV